MTQRSRRGWRLTPSRDKSYWLWDDEPRGRLGDIMRHFMRMAAAAVAAMAMTVGAVRADTLISYFSDVAVGDSFVLDVFLNTSAIASPVVPNPIYTGALYQTPPIGAISLQLDGVVTTWTLNDVLVENIDGTYFWYASSINTANGVGVNVFIASDTTSDSIVPSFFPNPLVDGGDFTLQISYEDLPDGITSGQIFDFTTVEYTPFSSGAEFTGSVERVSETPLPTALPLFSTGLGALGLFGWRRKRKTRVGIAN